MASQIVRSQRIPNLRHCTKASKRSNAGLGRKNVAPVCMSTSTSVQVQQTVRELLVPAADLKNCVQLRLVNEGRGQAIQVEYVSEGSAACEVGLKPGQRLRSIEDPMRSDVMYDLGNNPSLKFVLDTIMMSRHMEIKLKVQEAEVQEDDVLVADDTLSSSVRGSPFPPTTAVSGSERSRSVIEALETLTGSTSSGEWDGPIIAEQLEQMLQAIIAEGTAPPDDEGVVFLPLVPPTRAQREQAEQEARVLNSLLSAQTANTEGIRPTNEVQARIKRRKDYLDQVSQRNDSQFYSILFGTFVLPPAIILGAAYATGYMDTLYTNTLAHLH